MTRTAIFLALVMLCHGCAHTGHRRFEPHITPAWHWPCGESYRVATSAGDPDEFHYAVRRAIAKINTAAGRDLLRYVGREWDTGAPGTTMARLGTSAEMYGRGYSGGAMPVYRVKGKCIDRWEVTVHPEATAVDLILLHELGHVAGLEHIEGGVMAPRVPESHRADLSAIEAGLIGCMAGMYTDEHRAPVASQAPFISCISGRKGASE